MIKFIRVHLNSILWAIVILILCGSPSSGFPNVPLLKIPHLDKVVHWGLYVVFTLLLMSENNPHRLRGGVTRRAIIFALAIAVVYGIAIEVMQWLIFTSRSAEILDFIANTAGSTTAVLIYNLVNKSTKMLI